MNLGYLKQSLNRFPPDVYAMILGTWKTASIGKSEDSSKFPPDFREHPDNDKTNSNK
jgi:hypothetical protein